MKFQDIESNAPIYIEVYLLFLIYKFMQLDF